MQERKMLVSSMNRGEFLLRKGAQFFAARLNTMECNFTALIERARFVLKQDSKSLTQSQVDIERWLTEAETRYWCPQTWDEHENMWMSGWVDHPRHAFSSHEQVVESLAKDPAFMNVGCAILLKPAGWVPSDSPQW